MVMELIGRKVIEYSIEVARLAMKSRLGAAKVPAAKIFCICIT
jgi:hypothetical protein